MCIHLSIHFALDLSLNLTFALHEFFNVAVPVTRLWLHLVHAIKVEVRDSVVFGITGHVHHLTDRRVGIVRQGGET